jgi:hypothetical protein
VAVSSEENESSKMYSSGRFTRARAMASRCRCPPETLVPPCEMGASSPPSISRTKPSAWAMSSARHSLVLGGVRLAVLQVAADRAGKQVRPLRHQPDVPPQQVRVQLADVHAVDPHRAAGGVEQPRHEVHQGGLAGPGAADDRRRLPRPGGETDAGEDRLLGTRVGEPDVVHLQLAAPS